MFFNEESDLSEGMLRSSRVAIVWRSQGFPEKQVQVKEDSGVLQESDRSKGEVPGILCTNASASGCPMK